MKGSLLLFNLKLNCLIFFSTSLNSSLIIFIRTYTVNYRNALDRLCVRMNIFLLILILLTNNKLSTDRPTVTSKRQWSITTCMRLANDSCQLWTNDRCITAETASCCRLICYNDFCDLQQVITGSGQQMSAQSSRFCLDNITYYYSQEYYHLPPAEDSC